MSNIIIDIDKYSSWPSFEAWLNEVINHYSSNSVKPETHIDDNGNVENFIPSESDISTRFYALAHTADNSADTADKMITISEKNNKRRGDTLRGTLSDVAYDVREANIEETPVGDTLEEVLLRGETADITPDVGIDDLGVVGDSFRRNELVQWFSDCLPCDGRIEANLRTDLSIPEIILGLADFLGDLEDILDLAFGSFDSGRALASICSVMPLGKWCIRDLTALLTMLASLLNMYWLVDPSNKFSWDGILYTILFPILQLLYSAASMSVNISIGPLKCIETFLHQVRSAINAAETLEESLGMSLGHLQDTITSTGDLGSQMFGTTDQNLLRNLRGKSDWVKGDTLIDYASILNLLNPVEIALLAKKDFDLRFDSIADWLSSKISVMRSQSRETMFASLKWTNVLLAVGRLYSFIDALIKLISEGTEVCHERFDASGNRRFVPTEPVEDLFAGTGAIPEWVTIRTGPEIAEIATDGIDSTKNDKLTIIDNSLGSKHSSLGCLGRISAEEEEKVRQWMAELDDLDIS